MALPRDPDARRYYRAGIQRLDDARFILGDGGRRTTAAIYLAGYCVECLLKALILSQVAAVRRPKILTRLRTHSFEALRKLYVTECHAGIPGEVARDLSLLESWDSKLRYDPGTRKMEEAKVFLAAVERVRRWADERM
jgi:HEPN domain-containing protein